MILLVGLVDEVYLKFFHHIIIKDIFIKHRYKRKEYTICYFLCSLGWLFPFYIINIYFLLFLSPFFTEHFKVRKIYLVQVSRKFYALYFYHHHLLVDDLH